MKVTPSTSQAKRTCGDNSDNNAGNSMVLPTVQIDTTTAETGCRAMLGIICWQQLQMCTHPFTGCQTVMHRPHAQPTQMTPPRRQHDKGMPCAWYMGHGLGCANDPTGPKEAQWVACCNIHNVAAGDTFQHWETRCYEHQVAAKILEGMLERTRDTTCGAHTPHWSAHAAHLVVRTP
jgi:hypothetical protein